MATDISEYLPAFGICGWSGSGKTTVIEQAIRLLSAKGLKVGVIKHDVHGLNIDHEGKDSDRFFKAGADVVMRGPAQSFVRSHTTSDLPLLEVLKLMCPYYDVVLTEGHKSTPLFQKVWVTKEDGEECPPEAGNVKRVLKRDENRLHIVMGMLEEWLPAVWLSTPVYAAIMVDAVSKVTDANTRLAALADVLQPFAERVLILADGPLTGSADNLPVLPAANGGGPVAAVLSAMRWQPLASWLVVDAERPDLCTAEALARLLAMRRPGLWAIMPQPDETRAISLPAYFDFRARRLLEAGGQQADVLALPQVDSPVQPRYPSVA